LWSWRGILCAATHGHKGQLAKADVQRHVDLRRAHHVFERHLGVSDLHDSPMFATPLTFDVGRC
jgi:predicted CDP-diglyceride synthetase/phosphatidate cytidylyltransferase